MEKPIYSEILGKDLYGDATEAKWESLIYLTQSVRKGVSDQFLLNTPGQSIEPFVDFGNPASENKADAETNQSGSFWITGSKAKDVGEGFEQPLWAKTKIEIDITPSQKCGLQANDSIEPTASLNDNFMMGYWNKNAKLWQGIGSGKRFYSHFLAELSESAATNLNQEVVLTPFLEDSSTTIGFHWTHGYSTAGGGAATGFPLDTFRGLPINNYGFPFHPKFHATSSNLIPMSDYIDKPFLLEKIVLIFSASFSFGDGRIGFNSGALDTWAANLMTTFFILNQRNNFSFDFTEQYSITSRSFGARNPQKWTREFIVPTQSDPNYINSETGLPINTTRDLLTFMQTSTTNTTRLDLPNPDYNALAKEWTKQGAGGDIHKWSQFLTLSASTKMQYEYDSQPVEFCVYTDPAQDDDNDYVAYTFSQNYFNSTRNGAPQISGRGLLNELRTPTIISSTYYSADQTTIVVREDRKANNPYFLHPEDNLILGWQLPASQFISYYKSQGIGNDIVNAPFLTGSGFTFEFDNMVPQKVILYGSQIKEGKEHHDTLNQLLVANNVHEEIE
jgi:hypothetical protein